MQNALFTDYPTVVDRIKAQVDELLDPAEARRLQRPLALIERDRLIRGAFKRLRKQGYNFDVAIRKIAAEPWCGQYLSEDWVEEIIYPRNRK